LIFGELRNLGQGGAISQLLASLGVAMGGGGIPSIATPTGYNFHYRQGAFRPPSCQTPHPADSADYTNIQLPPFTRDAVTVGLLQHKGIGGVSVRYNAEAPCSVLYDRQQTQATANANMYM
jgi:hypothetical protein